MKELFINLLDMVSFPLSREGKIRGERLELELR